MPVIESDILGRRIEKLFITPTLDLTQTAIKLYTIGTSPWITPSKLEVISFVALAYTGNPGASVVTFGLSSSGTEWLGGATLSAFNDKPIMFYPSSSTAVRPGPFPGGAAFWMGNNVGWNAGATGVITIYGYPY